MYVAKMEKRSVKFLISFFGILFILYGFSETMGEWFGWCGLVMSLGIILLAVSLNSLLEEHVGTENMKYIWYCWIIVITALLGIEMLPLIK